MKITLFTRKNILIGLLAVFTLAALAFGVGQVLASRNNAPAAEPSPMHPTFAMLDAEGENVLSSGQPVSTMKTCGACHDTDFIVSHSFHAELGLNSYLPAKDSWNASDGVFGKWDPLTYRYLSQEGDERLDLSTAEWLMNYGDRIPAAAPRLLPAMGSR